jgi:mono/diheme cytochrome c family protein
MARALAIGACAWVLGGVASAAEPPAGPAVYEHWCAPCHAPGPGHPGTQSLQLKYKGQLPAVLLERTDLTAATVSTFVRQGVLLMAPFRKTEITDAQLSALSAYVAANFKAAPRQ